MPLGFERLNARKSQPNPNINFVKPLEGEGKAIAQDFLERIAAQCGQSYLNESKKHQINTNSHQFLLCESITCM
jgi:DNA-dependent metalloprotease WSS1